MDATGAAAQYRAGRDVHDGALLALLHCGSDSAAAQPHALDVHLHHAVPLILADLLEPHPGDRDSGEDGRIIDEPIDPSVPVEGRARHLLAAREPSDIGLDRERVSPLAAQLLRHRVRCGAIDISNDHLAALARNPPAVRSADPMAAASHDHHLILEQHVAPLGSGSAYDGPPPRSARAGQR